MNKEISDPREHYFIPQKKQIFATSVSPFPFI